VTSIGVINEYDIEHSLELIRTPILGQIRDPMIFEALSGDRMGGLRIQCALGGRA
jgi:hypothetical protein